MSNKPTICIIGTGLIGASWATCFIAHGFNVRAFDRNPDAKFQLTDFIKLSVHDVPNSLSVSDHGNLDIFATLEDAVSTATLIIENGPENLEIKQALLKEIDDYADNEAIVASSTSSLLLSQLSSTCKNPERVIIAHPFNPPHILPLVELFGIDDDIVQRASEIFTTAGKHPVIMKKEMTGHIANRLTSALFREALYMVEQGVASTQDIDAAISEGPGLRWALMGPFMGYHLGGGAGGIEHYMKHLGPSQVKRWADHGTPTWNDDLVETTIAQVHAATHGKSLDELTRERDEKLKAILDLKKKDDL